MVGYLASTANHLYGWGSHYYSDEKLIYTTRMRKTKIFVTGMTTFLTILNLVADWYNLSFFVLHTKRNIIEIDDSVTDNVFYALIVLCGLSTFIGFLELIAFVIQFRDARNYVTLRKRSELFEELVSFGILLVENTGIPLLFVIGYMSGSCAIAAQLRSLPARLALTASCVSAIWRMVQSFAYCCHARYSGCRFFCCQWLRYIRSFILVASMMLCVFLIALSLSIRTAIAVDDNNSGMKSRTQYADTVEGAYLYKRFVAPYQTIADGHNTQENDFDNCEVFESRIRIAKPREFRSFHKDKYFAKYRCSDVSPFYENLLRNKDRSLARTYDCYIIIALRDSDFRAARLINAGYELHDPDSNTCVSGNLDLTLDRLYDVTQSHKMDLEFMWNTSTLYGLSSSYCDSACTDVYDQYGGYTVQLNCSHPTCVNYGTSRDATELGFVSGLLVPERELMSIYPCASQILIDISLDLALCDGKGDNSRNNFGDNSTVVEYTTCLRPYITHVDKHTRKRWVEEERKQIM